MGETGTWRDQLAERTAAAREHGVLPGAAVSPESIPVALYFDVLHLLCSVAEEKRFWSICAAILRDACDRLDAGRIGLQLSVVQCMAPPSGNSVRYLQKRVVLGTRPWSEHLRGSGRLFGAESLAGQVTTTGTRLVDVNPGKAPWLPEHLPEHAASAAASPISYADRVAGCLLAVSTQPGFFSQTARLDLILNYAQLLTLAFRPEDFYERERLDLYRLPSLQEQQAAISTLPQRILALMKKAVELRHPISYDVAEQRVLWQMAEELWKGCEPQVG